MSSGTFQDAGLDPRRAFWIAVAVTVATLALQPWGRFLVYPFALLSTWAHELGHGLTALALGGRFESLTLYADLGGVALTATEPWARPLVALGGLLGPSLAGAGLLVLSARRRGASLASGLLAAALVASLLLWIRPLASFGFVALAVTAAGLAAVARWGSPMVRASTAMLLSIQFCLGNLQDFDYMFSGSAQVGGQLRASDTATIADAWWLPRWVWGGLIAATSLVILYAAFRVSWRRVRASR